MQSTNIEWILTTAECLKQKEKQKQKNTDLLKLEDVLVDVILQFLIRVVDAQLLKAVRLEVLEPKHIQNTDGQILTTENSTI